MAESNSFLTGEMSADFGGELYDFSHFAADLGHLELYNGNRAKQLSSSYIQSSLSCCLS